MTSRDFFNSLFHEQLCLKVASSLLSSPSSEIQLYQGKQRFGMLRWVRFKNQILTDLSSCWKGHTPQPQKPLRKIKLSSMLVKFYGWGCNFYRNKCWQAYLLLYGFIFAFPRIYWCCYSNVWSMKPLFFTECLNKYDQICVFTICNFLQRKNIR